MIINGGTARCGRPRARSLGNARHIGSGVSADYQKIRDENIARYAGTRPCWTCSAALQRAHPLHLELIQNAEMPARPS